MTWVADLRCESCDYLYAEPKGAMGEDIFWALPDGWDGCPECGHRRVNIAIWAAEQVPSQRDEVRIVGRPAAGGRPFYRARSGDSLYRATGKWNKVDQVVNERDGTFTKIITDGETGEVLRREIGVPLREKSERQRETRRDDRAEGNNE